MKNEAPPATFEKQKLSTGLEDSAQLWDDDDDTLGKNDVERLILERREIATVEPYEFHAVLHPPLERLPFSHLNEIISYITACDLRPWKGEEAPTSITFLPLRSVAGNR